MLLQTDPTVIYGFGAAFDGDLRRRDLVTDTPQYLYTQGCRRRRLFCRERAHWKAAVHPAAGDALYFVADGQGGHVFQNAG